MLCVVFWVFVFFGLLIGFGHFGRCSILYWTEVLATTRCACQRGIIANHRLKILQRFNMKHFLRANSIHFESRKPTENELANRVIRRNSYRNEMTNLWFWQAKILAFPNSLYYSIRKTDSNFSFEMKQNNIDELYEKSDWIHQNCWHHEIGLWLHLFHSFKSLSQFVARCFCWCVSIYFFGPVRHIFHGTT